MNVVWREVLPYYHPKDELSDALNELIYGSIERGSNQFFDIYFVNNDIYYTSDDVTERIYRINIRINCLMYIW